MSEAHAHRRDRTGRRAESVAVVIAARNEGAELARTVAGLTRTTPPSVEIVVVDDASRDGCADQIARLERPVVVLRPGYRQGVARARNLGARHSTAETLVFADAHVDVPDGWLTPLLDAVADPRVGCAGPALLDRNEPEAKGYGLYFSDDATNVEWVEWYGGGSQPVPLLLGFFVVIKRALFERLGGYDPGMRGWGMEDNELSMRTWRCGYECRAVSEVEVSHLFRRNVPGYQLEWTVALHNILRLGALHFARKRLARLIAAYQDDPALPGALSSVLAGDAARRRELLGEPRESDTDFFFGEAPPPGGRPSHAPQMGGVGDGMHEIPSSPMRA